MKHYTLAQLTALIALSYSNAKGTYATSEELDTVLQICEEAAKLIVEEHGCALDLSTPTLQIKAYFERAAIACLPDDLTGSALLEAKTAIADGQYLNAFH